MPAFSEFSDAEAIWTDRLGNLRNVVRQHVISRQLAGHLRGGESVLDVGCGQGTQAIRLASLGFEVTGVDQSRSLLERLTAAADEAGVRVEAVQGSVESLDEAVGGRTFDLVCAHGLLMYLDDAEAALSQISARVAPGGRISFTVRNGDALAYRPGIRGDFDAALDAFDATTYVNELGVQARAHRYDEVVAWCEALGMEIESWYGVRVLTDGVSTDVKPDDVDLAACLATEVEAGRRDPYRRLGSMLHFVARIG